MIDPGRVAALAATAFVVIVIPGPGVLFVVSRGVSLGRRAALGTVVGHWAGLMTQVAAVAAGVGAIVERSIAAFTLLKLIGAAYLVWLGWEAIRHRHRLAIPVSSTHRPSTRRILRDGYIVGVSNPKGFLLFASILPQFVTPNGAPVPLQLVLLGLVCGAIALVSDSVWAVAAGTARAWLARSPRRLARIGAAGGVATIGLGIRLAVTGRHD